MQTRSMTKRAGTPHDLEAFNSYAEDLTFYVDEHLKTKKRVQKLDDDHDDSSSDDTYVPSDSEDSENESTNSEWFPEDTHIPGWGYDPKHFCQSWCKCCEDNLQLKQ